MIIMLVFIIILIILITLVLKIKVVLIAFVIDSAVIIDTLCIDFSCIYVCSKHNNIIVLFETLVLTLTFTNGLR